jgi:hypothetical protein
MSDYVKTGEPLRASWANDVVRDLRRNKASIKKRTLIIGGGGGVSGCPFGKIVTYTEGEGEAAETKTGILGGTISAGDKNFNVANKELNLESDSVTLIYLEISVTANRDDANEILLPGLETSTETDTSSFWKSIAWNDPITQYPDNTRPVLTSGVGKIIVPIGKLTIDGGTASLKQAGCGNITLDHCGGTLTSSRG